MKPIVVVLSAIGVALVGLLGALVWVMRATPEPPEQSIDITEKRRAEFADDERH
jgi:uncharacterized membrane protein